LALKRPFTKQFFPEWDKETICVSLLVESILGSPNKTSIKKNTKFFSSTNQWVFSWVFTPTPPPYMGVAYDPSQPPSQSTAQQLRRGKAPNEIEAPNDERVHVPMGFHPTSEAKGRVSIWGLPVVDLY